ncbi:hypothetical protein [Arthrobacter sp. H35-D1]|uniref:hypothetical protein n=1 Tax=Arthrobacter sp. H35-D1 TaxID=3046202 RepID=UPI0024B88753|nr:hypothetical protein [Arthrobacter sp. H35-D1]MDJ0315243.1 hypothetical protein [Arthrobacter sp. H35-D1]
MTSPEHDKMPGTEPVQIEERLARRQVELRATVVEFSARLNIKKQAKLQWGQVCKQAENRGFVLADDFRLAWVRVQNGTLGIQAAVLSSALALIGGIVLVLVLVRRKTT